MNDPETERHWHWEFTAFNGPDPADFNRDQRPDIHWGVYVTVIGYWSEEDARIAAQAIVRREVYRLHRAWECQTCGFQNSATAAMQTLADAAKG